MKNNQIWKQRFRARQATFVSSRTLQVRPQILSTQLIIKSQARTNYNPGRKTGLVIELDACPLVHVDSSSTETAPLHLVLLLREPVPLDRRQIVVDPPVVVVPDVVAVEALIDPDVLFDAREGLVLPHALLA